MQTLARVLGADHPDTLTGRGNLPGVLRDLGQLHPDTLTSRSQLASVLHALGRRDEADQAAGLASLAGTLFRT